MFRVTGNAGETGAVFAAAQRILGVDPRDFVRFANEQALRANRAAQILCVTQALAARVLLEGVLPTRCIVVGYSVGEVAACSIAGLLRAEEALDLARLRAELMDRASLAGDGLAFVRGLPLQRVTALVRDAGVEIAIVNPGNVFIVGGAGPQLQRFCEAALNTGAARAERLPVVVASHTSRFAKAASALQAAAARYPKVSVREGVALLSGLDGSLVTNTDDAENLLVRQLSTTLRWADALNAAIERGGRVFLELGPGCALRDMIRAAYPAMIARSIDDFDSAAGLRSWLERQELANRNR